MTPNERRLIDAALRYTNTHRAQDWHTYRQGNRDVIEAGLAVDADRNSSAQGGHTLTNAQDLCDALAAYNTAIGCRGSSIVLYSDGSGRFDSAYPATRIASFYSHEDIIPLIKRHTPRKYTFIARQLHYGGEYAGLTLTGGNAEKYGQILTDTLNERNI